MGQIVWSRRIVADIYAAAEYHRPFAPAFADKLIDEIFSKGQLLEAHPLVGRLVPEANRYSGATTQKISDYLSGCIC
ncbi:MAG: type II toxin-antitoxin system RelE/ParE family toxin [Hymenobacter sp.]|nr:MAG: type II toxin-antitoxin system RelE/ParE family toxin [Hymenobacter sp.]